MCGVSSARQRSRGRAAPVARAAAEMVIVAAVTTVMAVDAGTGAGAGAGMVLTGRRKATDVTGVVNWATGPMNAGPKPRRSRLSARGGRFSYGCEGVRMAMFGGASGGERCCADGVGWGVTLWQWCQVAMLRQQGESLRATGEAVGRA
jgi:hypothetical protein